MTRVLIDLHAAAGLVGAFLRHDRAPGLAAIRLAIERGDTQPRDGAIAAVRLFVGATSRG